MTIQQIRDSRRVPAKRGGRIIYSGGTEPKMGTITGARNGYLQIRLDGEKRSGSYHPTWKIQYLDSEAGA